MKAYLLIRIAVDVGREEWFGVKLDQKLPEPTAVKESRPSDIPKAFKPSHSLLWTLRHPRLVLQQRKERRMEQQQEKERRRREEQERTQFLGRMETQLLAVEAAIQRLSCEVREMLEDTQDCFCVYEDSVRKALAGDTDVSRWDTFRELEERQEDRAPGLTVLWRKYFPLEEFRGYFQQFWVDQLLPEAVWPHFVVFGTAPCLPALMEKYANRMKSLRWILSETDCNPELLEFVEDFYTEYGLAIALQPMESPAALGRLRLTFDIPVNILDFTEEVRLTTSEVPEGSVWLDMRSMEEKRRRVKQRCGMVTYISLKEKWKTAQKRCSSPILP